MQNNMNKLLPPGHKKMTEAPTGPPTTQNPGAMKRWNEKLITGALFPEKVVDLQRKLCPTGEKEIGYWARAVNNVWSEGLTPEEIREVKDAVVAWNKGPIPEVVQHM